MKRISKKLKLAVLEKQGLKCAGCGRTITLESHRLRDWKKTLGHWPDKSVPSRAYFHRKRWGASGGEYTLTNTVALCGRCHAKPHRYYEGYKDEGTSH